MEASEDIASIIPLYQDEGFGLADLMIRQAAHLSGVKGLKTFDQKLAKLSGVDLLGMTHLHSVSIFWVIWARPLKNIYSNIANTHGDSLT